MTPLHSFKRILHRSHRKYLIVVLVSSMVLLGFGMYEVKRTLVILPGTEPGTVAGADDVTICRQCHHSTSVSKPVTIYDEWAGSMMAHSARDPIFYAALAVANKYNSVTGQAHGEFCIRCHSPNGWLAGHSEDYTGQSLTGTDFDGVQCDYCHRAVDPLNPDSTVPHLNSQVPGYGNGMHVVQRYSTPKRGPFDSVSAPHGIKYDSFQKTSELCGVCHDVSNPFYAENAALQAPHSYAPLERTYSEWLMSWYATQSDSGTCQACHMETTSGFACILGDSSSLRTNLPTHDLTGGNTFLPDILPDFDTFFNSQSRIDTAALAGGKLR
ncbi:MAG TPA: multiheme c-type cytochrome, partial [Bacteroidota bacterium]|nr:multiheme c-type cytochrome [Bacteroidota bacterium]